MTPINVTLICLNCLLAGVAIGLTFARSRPSPGERSDASLRRTLDGLARAMEAANGSLAEQVTLLREQNAMLKDDDDEADWWKRGGDESPAAIVSTPDPGGAP